MPAAGTTDEKSAAVRIFRFWCPREESNLDSRLRSPEFYPLNYGGYYSHTISPITLPMPRVQYHWTYTMTRFLKQKIWHRLFEVGVALKALNSAWETLAGVFLLTRLHSWLSYIIIFFGRSQLLGGRDDFLFKLLSDQIRHLDVVSVRTFVGIYLLFHGLMNAFLAYNLYRNRLWAYPVMIVFISLFMLYQVYRLFHTHSVVLFGVTLFDFVFIFLTWHEYQTQKNTHELSST